MSANPPDKVLQFLLNLLYHQMLDKNSQFYLPRLVASQRDPTYEPYVIDGTWTLSRSDDLRNAGCFICFATAPDDVIAGAPPAGTGNGDLICGPDNTFALPSEAPLLTLASPNHVDFDGKVPFQISGLSNVTPGQPLVTEGENAEATATFSTVADWQHADGLAITGNFTIRQPCCASDDGKSCKAQGKTWNNDGFGIFSALLKKSQVSIKGTAYTEGKYLQLQITGLGFEADVSAANLVISVEIMSISDPKVRAAWASTLKLALNAPETRSAIVSNIQSIVDSNGVRRDVQDALNSQLKKLSTEAALREALATAPEEVRRLTPRHLLG